MNKSQTRRSEKSFALFKDKHEIYENIMSFYILLYGQQIF